MARYGTTTSWYEKFRFLKMSNSAQHSVHPNPDKVRRGRGGGTLRGAFSGSLCGLKLIPSKWPGLVPGEHRDAAQSHPPVPRRGITQTVRRHIQKSELPEEL